MDGGYQIMLGQVLKIQAEAGNCMTVSNQRCVEAVVLRLKLVESSSSSANFRQLKMFLVPADFEFQAHGGDEVCSWYRYE